MSGNSMSDSLAAFNTIPGSRQQEPWRDFQLRQRRVRLRVAVEQALEMPITQVRFHLDSYLALISNSRPFQDLQQDVVDLIAALHPWPLRWQKWLQWHQELHFAIDYCRARDLPELQTLFSADLAGLLLAWGQYQKAISTAKQAISLAEHHGLVLPLAMATYHLVDALNSTGKSEQAEELLTQLEEKAGHLSLTAPADLVRATAYFVWHRMTFLRRRGELTRAVEIGSAVIAQIKALTPIDSHLLAQSQVHRSTIYWSKTEYQPALTDLTHAIDLFTEGGDLLAAETARGNMGLVYYSMGQLTLAERTTQQAILQMEAVGANWELIRVLGNLVAIHMARGFLSPADYYLARQIELVNQFGDTSQMMLARSNQATLNLCTGQYSEALKILHVTSAFYEQQGYRDVELVILLEISYCHLQLGQMEQAIEFARRAEAICNTTDSRLLRSFLLRHSAILPLPEPRRPLAVQALALSREQVRPVDIAACLLTLVRVTEDETERDQYWQESIDLLQEIGATGWLDGASPQNPPFIPYML